MSVTIRRAEPDEASTLTTIAHAAKRYWNYPDSWILAWRAQLTVTPEDIRTHRVHVAEVDRRVVGFYALSGHVPVLELDHLWVDPPFIGRGLGRWLVEHSIAEARHLGARRIELDSDPHAEPFYLRVGARRIGKTPAPVEDDGSRFLPRLTLELVG